MGSISTYITDGAVLLPTFNTVYKYTDLAIVKGTKDIETLLKKYRNLQSRLKKKISH